MSTYIGNLVRNEIDIKKQTVYFLLLLLMLSWTFFYFSADVDDMATHYLYSKKSTFPKITSADIDFGDNTNKYILLNNTIKATALFFKVTKYHDVITILDFLRGKFKIIIHNYKKDTDFAEYVGSVVFFATAINFIFVLLILSIILQTYISKRGVYIFTLTFIVTILGSLIWIFLKSLNLEGYLLTIPQLGHFWGVVLGSLNQNFELYSWAPRSQVFILAAATYLLLLSKDKRKTVIILLLIPLMFLIHIRQTLVVVIFLFFSELFTGIFKYLSQFFFRGKRMTANLFKLIYFGTPLAFNILMVFGVSCFLYYIINYSVQGTKIPYFKILMSIFVNSTLYIAIIFSYIFIPILFGSNILSRRVSGLFDEDRDIQWMKGIQLTSFIIYLLIVSYLLGEIYLLFRDNLLFWNMDIERTKHRAESTFVFIIRMQIVAIIFFFLLNKGAAFVDKVKDFYIRRIISNRLLIMGLILLTVFFGYMRLSHVQYEFKRNLYSRETTPNTTSDKVKSTLFSASKIPHKWFAEMDGGEITNPKYGLGR